MDDTTQNVPSHNDDGQQFKNFLESETHENVMISTTSSLKHALQVLQRVDTVEILDCDEGCKTAWIAIRCHKNQLHTVLSLPIVDHWEKNSTVYGVIIS